MKILFVIHRYWPYPGGAERYVQEMAERLVREGHRAAVVTTDAWDVEYFFAGGRRRVDRGNELCRGVPVTRLRARRFPFHTRACRLLSALAPVGARWRFVPPSPLVPSLGRELERHRDADLVHFTSLPFDSLMHASFSFARRRGIPYLITPFIHFGEPCESRGFPSRLRAIEARILRESDLVIAQTRLEKDVLARAGVDPGRVVVLGMGVNPGELRGGSGERFRERHGISPRDTMILHVAEKTMEKGSMHLVEAARRLRARGASVTTVLAGASMRDFSRYLRGPGADMLDSCVLLDAVTGQEKEDMFAASDIHAMTSKTDSYGIVYLESWLAGRPVIGAFAGGVAELIEDGEDGFLVPFGNVAMLAESLWTLIRDRGLRDRMGERGRRKVLASCTWDRRYAVFRELLETTARPRPVNGGGPAPIERRAPDPK